MFYIFWTKFLCIIAFIYISSDTNYVFFFVISGTMFKFGHPRFNNCLYKRTSDMSSVSNSRNTHVITCHSTHIKLNHRAYICITMIINSLSKSIAVNLFEAVTNAHRFLPITKVTYGSLTHPCKSTLDLKVCLTVLTLYIQLGIHLHLLIFFILV